MTDTSQLKRVRWGVRAVLILGVAASITGNVLHAEDAFIAQAIAAWAPMALLLTIELIARVPVHRRGLAVLRWTVTAVIAGIAAWVSYGHQMAVAKHYGETGASPYLLPLSVDGLIVVASICLVELGGRIRAADEEEVSTNEVERRREGDAEADVRSDHQVDAGQRQEGAAGREEEVAPVTVEKVSTPRKPHPSSADRVIRAHKRTPAATDGDLAKRLNLSTKTVRQYRPRPPAEPSPINGHDHQLVGAGDHEKEN